MRHLITAAVTVAALALAGCSSAASTPASSTRSTTAPAASSCHAQFEAWLHGPAKAAGKRLDAQFRTVAVAGNARDFPRLAAALKAAGRDVTALQAYPIPRCADPHLYWPQLLARLRAAADDARSGSGSLGSVALALVPLRQVPGLVHSLSAELKQTVGARTAFG